jgi:hypothetical protein
LNTFAKGCGLSTPAECRLPCDRRTDAPERSGWASCAACWSGTLPLRCTPRTARSTPHAHTALACMSACTAPAAARRVDAGQRGRAAHASCTAVNLIARMQIDTCSSPAARPAACPGPPDAAGVARAKNACRFGCRRPVLLRLFCCERGIRCSARAPTTLTSGGIGSAGRRGAEAATDVFELIG